MRPGWRDWLVAVVAAAASMNQGWVGPPVEPSPLSTLAGGLLGIAGGLALAWRRRSPVTAAAAAICLSTLQALIAGPQIPVVGWLAVLAFARHVPDLRDALRGAASAAFVVAAAQVAAGFIHHRVGGLALVLSFTLVMLLAAAAARLQQARRDAQRREWEATRREWEATRQQAVTAERLRIARDLHDLVGHGLSTVAIQSSAARLALDSGDAAAAKRAMASVERASRGALAEMRQLLGVLRHVDAESVPPAGPNAAGFDVAGLDGVEALADGARMAGHVVTVHRSGPLERVPPAAGLCAYRVVQEALTNAARHAPGAAMAVSLLVAADELTVEVTDTGGDRPGGSREAGPRYGLVGLRERVSAAGGTIEAGPRPDRAGWRLVARLPLSEEGR